MSNFVAIFEGRLSREVRLGVNKSNNSKVTNLTIAVEMGENKKTTKYIDVAFWGQLSEEAGKLVKGQLVKIQVDSLNVTTNQVPKKDGKKGEMTTFTNIQTNGIALKAGALPRTIVNSPNVVEIAVPSQMPIEAFDESIPF